MITVYDARLFQVIHEALTGYRVNWKKALQLLTKRFSDVNNCRDDERPCILLIDELDLLVTRNQSVSIALPELVEPKSYFILIFNCYLMMLV